MKILCICSHGNIRSAALAYILKALFNQEAIAIGYKEVTPGTLQYMAVWADRIVALDAMIFEYLDRELDHPANLFLIDAGEDIWKDPFAQGLIHKLYKGLSKNPELWKQKDV